MSDIQHSAALRQRVEAPILNKASDIPASGDIDTLKLLHELQVQKIELELQNEELQKALANSRQIEERYKGIVESQSEFVERYLPGGVITYANEALVKFTGLALEDLLGRSFYPFIHEEDRDEIIRQIQTISINNPTVETENRILFDNGRLCWTRWTQTGIFDKFGTLIEYQSVGKDITEQKVTELALRESEQKYRLLFESAEDSITVMDLQGKLLTVNPMACEMLGYTNDELMSLPANKIDSSPDEMMANISSLLDIGYYVGETEFFHKDGSIVPISVHARLIEWDSKPAIMNICRDITVRKRIENNLQLSEKLYRSLFENMMNGFAYCRMIYKNGNPVDFIYLAVNEAFETQTGLKNLTGKKATEAIPGIRETDNEIFGIYGRVAKTGKSECFEIFVSALDSWFSVAVYSPSPEHFVAIFDVITERKKNIEALNYTNECFNQALNGSQSILYRFNVKTGYDYLSPAFEKITGHPLEIYKKINIEKLADYYHPDDLSTARALIDKALCSRTCQTVPIEYEFRFKKADGTYCWLHDSTTAYFNENNELEYYFGSAYDITERKKAEEESLVLEQQLQQTQRLESLGVLAGGIAHDFNNLLLIIIGHCSLAKLRPTKALDSIKPIETAAERAAELCQQMLAYAGKSNFIKSEVHLNELVNEMVEMAKSFVGKNVEIKGDVASDIPSITVDASQIRQVIMNLILNASEAIAESQGTVHVNLDKKAVNSDQLTYDYLSNIIPPGWYACLEVTDNGCGMDVETQLRIFEPFYTTKFTGRGLGMSAVLGIIKKHNGALQLFSKPGMGSTFKVYIPVQRGETGRVKLAQLSEQVPWKGKGTILLVDDEEEIRTIAELMLDELGFTVIKALNGKEALDIYQKYSADISLVLTDIGMPVMDGYSLFHELKKLRPDLPIIISSGFGDTDITSRIQKEELAGLISKPYNFEQLEEIFKSILG